MRWLVWLGLLVCTPALVAQTTAVTVASAAELGLTRSHRAPAEVLSLNRSPIAAEVEGVVLEVRVDVGATVDTGAILIALDDSDLQIARERIEADIASTRARIEQAELRLKRARDLSRRQFVSDDDLLARETDLRVLGAELRRQRVELEAARRDIGRTRIVAPFAGVVGARSAQLGSLLKRGDRVVTLVDTRRFELEAEIPGEYAPTVLTAVESVFSAAGARWPVRLERLSPVIEAGRRIRRARYRFVDEAPAIGTSGELRWQTAERVLPPHVLVRRQGSLGVFVVRGDAARFVELPGAEEGRPVTHQLPDGERIVVDGRERLQDGDLVQIFQPPA